MSEDWQITSVVLLIRKLAEQNGLSPNILPRLWLFDDAAWVLVAPCTTKVLLMEPEMTRQTLSCHILSPMEKAQSLLIEQMLISPIHKANS